MKYSIIAILILAAKISYGQQRDSLASSNVLVPIVKAAIAKAVVYTSIHEIVSQTGIGTPTALRMDSNYNAVTLTWNRTGIGVYTLTASQPIFSITGRTVCFIGGLINNNYKLSYIITSPTVITFTTSVISIASTIVNLIITSAMNYTATDGIFNNTGILIFNYQ